MHTLLINCKGGRIGGHSRCDGDSHIKYVTRCVNPLRLNKTSLWKTSDFGVSLVIPQCRDLRGFCSMPKKTVVPGVNDLATTRPLVAAQWHMDRNGNLLPTQVTYGSKKIVWWQCEKDLRHEWQSSINQRSETAGSCPVCNGRKVIAGVNDLATTHPEIAATWDFERNATLLPAEISRGSSRKVWWLCDKPPSHSFEMAVNNRTKGESCGICAGQIIFPGVNDLATKHPDIAAEWHPTKNFPRTPEGVGSSYSGLVWWTCPTDPRHEYRVAPKTRVYMKTRCSICTGHQVQKGINDLRTTHPGLVTEWDFDENEVLPESISFGTHKKFWWRCKENSEHRWQSSPNARVGAARKHGCPLCAGQLVIPGVNDFLTTHPELRESWSFQRNSGVDHTTLRWGSSRKKFWWICERDKRHEYQNTVIGRLRRGCPVCAGKAVVQGINDLATTHPTLAREWHPEKNRDLRPTMFTSGSSRERIWWQCKENNEHVWQTYISTRVYVGTGCPTCADSGFDTSRPGTFYLIINPELRARKIGIANPGRKIDRLSNWKRNGWKILQSIRDDDGRIILDLETEILRWIRKDLCLPPFLSSEDLGSIGGASETFSADGPSDSEVWGRALEILEDLKQGRRKTKRNSGKRERP